MYCSHCGAPNADNSRFCESCGADISADAPVKARKPMSRKTLLILTAAIAAAVIGLVVLIIVLNLPTTIVLDDYLTVSFSGFDTHGEVSLDVHGEDLIKALSEGLSPEGKKELRKLIAAGKLMFELDKHDELKNGDTVNLKVTVDEKAFEELDLKLVVKKTAYEVTGLKAMTVFDPFQYLKVEYEGFEPYASIRLINTAEDPYLADAMYFYTSQTDDLSEGMIISIEAELPYSMGNYGYQATRMQMNYTLTGVPQPVEVDLFANLQISFTGVDGQGKLHYTEPQTEDPFLSNVYYSFSTSSGLTAGDTITCTAGYYRTPEQYGYKVSATEKTYTVPTLGTYVTDYTVLSDEVKQQLIDKATEKIREHYLATYPSGVMYTDKSVLSTTYYLEDYQAVENISLVAVYTGVYSSWLSDDRETGFIFSADFSGHNTEAANTTGYFYAYFENLIVNEDGSLQTGWEESVYLKGNAYVSEQLLKDKCLSGHDELVFTQQ